MIGFLPVPSALALSSPSCGVYLASDAAAYLTGQVIWIEGGAFSHA